MSEAPLAPPVADRDDESPDDASPIFERRGSAARPQPMDPWLFFAAIALSCLGLVMVYSAGAWFGHEVFHSWEYFLERQAAFLVVGVVLMLGISRIDYRLLRRFAPQLMLAALAMLLVVLVVGQEINGARRWIRVGPVGLQPSELAKITLAIFLAATLARQGERVRMFKRGFMPVVAVAGFTMLMVLLEKDLGTTILLGSLTLIMLFTAGTRLSYVVAAVMLAAPIVWQQIIGVDYRRGRLEEFMAGDGYQVHQALISIGSGGPFGLGLGHGRQKLGFLPENHTDFILATIGEELGLLGIAIVLMLVALLVWRGLLIARQASDRFGTYLATGLSALFGLQALVNMAVVLEVVPAKGITLPFLSYGGSSLLASMAAVGILLSISRRPAPWRWSDQRGRRRESTHAPGPRHSAGPPRPRNIRRPVEASPSPA
ncbi:putative lipid II flippase FtsW [Paraliomyxa miuraensis]|uniref:putative lipid II flippase FtsW n=1 Tax=Paraliomyxa miuraensis TaxID=376150 RepID=UPI00224DA9A8|nr:putative lipid II flippase FtsW [Paraliomyxa miuraensis]MCX4248044.1 putative lipid II flippase FtsW [Paraliomyxa miuraensis]